MARGLQDGRQRSCVLLRGLVRGSHFMFCHRIETCQHEVVRGDADAALWCRESVQAVADMQRIIKSIAAAMARAGFPEKEMFALHLALEEAIVNANKHGHQGDWTLPLAVRYHVSADGVVVQVEDHGPGFAPEEVPDPLAPENLERASGRGLLLIRTY